MTLIALTDIALLLIVGVPVLLIYRSWARWVDRLADRLWPFEKPRRFGLRSWAARSFVLNTPAEEVRRRLNELTEMEWSETGLGSSKAREVISSGLAALSPLLGVRKVSTGVEVEWLDDQTAAWRTLAQQPVAAAGGWANDEFTAKICFAETPQPLFWLRRFL